MKCLLDEQLSPEIADFLSARGLDVVAVVRRRDLVGASDLHLLDAAATEGRAVVTADVKDFRRLAAQRLARGLGHGGLILLPARRSRTRSTAAPLAVAIEMVMRANPDGLAGSERWIAPSGSQCATL